MDIVAFLSMMTAYLIGSISSAVLVCRLFRLPDPRFNGSNNPGTTNVYRLGGKIPAIIVLLFDVLKGLVPVWCGFLLGLPPVILGGIAICACLGHMYPLFFHFIGGKGVATALGAVLPIGLDLAGLLLITWGITLLVSGYSSLSALVAVLLAPVYTWIIKPEYTLPVTMLTCIIILRHRENITRLLKHTESKVVRKKP